jgi:hypothetical protein
LSIYVTIQLLKYAKLAILMLIPSSMQSATTWRLSYLRNYATKLSKQSSILEVLDKDTRALRPGGCNQLPIVRMSTAFKVMVANIERVNVTASRNVNTPFLHTVRIISVSKTGPKFSAVPD